MCTVSPPQPAPGFRALTRASRSVNQTKGRPRQEGDRYPSGKLKASKLRPSIEPIAPALWDRARTAVIETLNDVRFGSELGRLSLRGEITAHEASAGFRLADIYGRFERYKGKRRSAASPSYMVASSPVGNDDSVEAITPEMLARSMAEELLDAEQLTALEANITVAAARMEKLQKFMRQLPSNTIAALELLCVEDRMVNPLIMEDVRIALDMIAGFFRAKAAPKEKEKKKAEPMVVYTPVHAEAEDPDRAAWMVALAKLRPDLTEPQRIEAYNMTVALKMRAVVRAAQEKARLTRVPSFGSAAPEVE